MLVVAVEQLIFIASVGALLKMWHRNDGGVADAMGPRWLVIMPIAIGMIAWLTSQVPLSSALSTLALVATGLVLYALSKGGAVKHEGVILPERRA